MESPIFQPNFDCLLTKLKKERKLYEVKNRIY